MTLLNGVITKNNTLKQQIETNRLSVRIKSREKTHLITIDIVCIIAFSTQIQIFPENKLFCNEMKNDNKNNNFCALSISECNDDQYQCPDGSCIDGSYKW